MKRIFYIFFFSLTIFSAYSQSAGYTPIEVQVNDRGGTECEIPISIPFGTAEMKPNISLRYNSQSGVGIVGYGWHLSGVSQIERVPKNLYFDSKISAIQMDTSDRFALDGQRLFALNNKKYGSDGCVYGTEEESYIRVESYTLGADYPQYFLTTLDDGSVARYGMSETSSKLHWYMDSLADKNGNYILYHYKSFENNILINSISYTGNYIGELKPYNCIIFQYDTLGIRSQVKYVANLRIIQQNILKSIVIKNDNEILRKYVLSYDTSSSFYPCLTQVQEFGTNNQYYAPICFNYGTYSTVYNNWQGIKSKQTVPNQRILSGNFFDSETNTFLRLYVNNNRIWLCDTNESNVLSIGPWNHPYGGNYTFIKFNALSCDIDVNNTDEVLLNVAISTQNNYKYDKGLVYWCRYIGNAWEYYSLPENTSPDQVLFGNFDDNPALDYIYVKDGKLQVFPNFCDSRNNSSSTSINVGAKEKLEAIDIDGDGIMELMIIHPQNGGRIYKNNRSININFQSFQCSIPKLTFDTNTRVHIYLGDVNGDGITDMFTRCEQTIYTPPFKDTAWVVFLGTGKGFSTYSFAIKEISKALPSPNDVYFQLIDINGDGKDDIIHVSESENGSSSIHIYLSVGFTHGKMYQNFHTKKYFINTNLLSGKMKQIPLIFSDGDKDGIIDIAWVCTDGTIKGITRGGYQHRYIKKI